MGCYRGMLVGRVGEKNTVLQKDKKINLFLIFYL